MKPIVYLIIFAVVALIFKAMFLDDYLNKSNKVASDVNQSSLENNSSTYENNNIAAVDDNLSSQITTNSEFQKKMDDTPLDRFFNSVAEKLEDKL